MTLQIEPRHDLSPDEVDAIEDRLYDHNSHVTGRHDGQGLGFVIRDGAGQMIGSLPDIRGQERLSSSRCGLTRYIGDAVTPGRC
jgi:hypothetical protein